MNAVRPVRAGCKTGRMMTPHGCLVRTYSVDLLQLRQPLDLLDVNVGIVTALREEYAACRHVIDPNNLGQEIERYGNTGRLTCWVCQMEAKHGGFHTIAITLLLNAGNSTSAIASQMLLQHCPGIRHLIMCGIAGGVPCPKDANHHVRLGDIVVSNEYGVIHYNRGKQRAAPPNILGSGASADPFAGFELRSYPRAPCPALLAAVERMHADECILKRGDPREWEIVISDFLTKRGPGSDWIRPGKKTDKLDDSSDGKSAPIPHPRDYERRRGCPRVFHGPIGAADIVLGDPVRRDALRDRYGVKAIEMEGWGVADASWIASIGYLIVRGTCDYCNSGKADRWHKYCALIAAAYTRCVLHHLHANNMNKLSDENLKSVPILSESTDRTASQNEPPSKVVPSAKPSAVDEAARPTDATVKKRSEVGVSIQLPEQPPLSPVQRSSIEAGVVGMNVVDQAALSQLKDMADLGLRLLKEGEHKELEVLATELEKRLKLVPKVGSEVRQGWILLGKIELNKALHSKMLGDEVNVERLEALQKEADSVV